MTPSKKSTTVHANPIPAPIRLGFRVMPKLSEGLTVRAAEHLFCRPRRFRPHIEEKRWLANAERFPVRIGNRTLRGYSWGRGPAVLLVHGWEGRGGQMTPLVPALVEAGFRAITWDAVGHGRSPGRTSSLVEFADGVWSAARAVMADGPLHGPLHGIVAHSMGSAAVGLALHEGLTPERVAFIAPPHNMDTYAGEFARLLGLSDHVRDRMVRSIERRLNVRMADLTFDRIEPERPTPLLVVHDVEDREVPFEYGERIVAGWKGAQLKATRGLGHKRILRDPGVVRSVTRWLKLGATVAGTEGQSALQLGCPAR